MFLLKGKEDEHKHAHNCGRQDGTTNDLAPGAGEPEVKEALQKVASTTTPTTTGGTTSIWIICTTAVCFHQIVVGCAGASVPASNHLQTVGGACEAGLELGIGLVSSGVALCIKACQSNGFGLRCPDACTEVVLDTGGLLCITVLHHGGVTVGLVAQFGAKGLTHVLHDMLRASAAVGTEGGHTHITQGAPQITTISKAHFLAKTAHKCVDSGCSSALAASPVRISTPHGSILGAKLSVAASISVLAVAVTLFDHGGIGLIAQPFGHSVGSHNAQQ
jgi:hypothetical protein